MKMVTKIVSVALILPLLAPGLAPVNLAQAAPLSQAIAEETNEIASERTNLVFLEGELGDSHLAYTYLQDGKSYKVVEDATEDFKYVNSTIYTLDASGIYIENSTLEFATHSDGNATVTIEDADGTVETQVITSSFTAESSKTQSADRTSSAEWEWITDYYTGSTHVGNYTIQAIIAALSAVATRFVGPVAGSAVAAVAQSLFSRNAAWAYYYKIYNWRHSEYNYLVIEETDWTGWYADAAHNTYLGYTYTEYFWD